MTGKRILESILVKPAGPDCNLACDYCFYRAKESLFPDRKQHRMGPEILEETIKQLMAGSGRQVSIVWQGGEPSLMGLDFYQRAVELEMKYGRDKTAGNGFMTNGLLLNRDWARFFKKYNFLVGLSLDGPEHIHDRYRKAPGGKGSWSGIVDRARLLLDEGASVNAVSVVNDYSVNFPEEIYGFHKDLGLTFMQFIPIVETDPHRPDRAAPFSVSGPAYGNFLCRLLELWLADFKNGLAVTSIRLFDSLFHHYIGLTPPDCTLRQTCGPYLVVEHNGDVYSCDFFVEPEWKLGSVLSGRLDLMLNGDVQNRFRQMKAEVPDECQGCQWLALCRGGCIKDRRRDPRDRGLNHFCAGFKMFMKKADPVFKKLALDWRAGSQRQEPRKIGRNSLCPCGSGLKYKRCCGKG